jgi:chemotaxis protein MotB
MIQKLMLSTVLIRSLLLFSCVSKKKLDAAYNQMHTVQLENNELKAKQAEMQSQLDKSQSSNQTLTTSNQTLNNENTKLKADYAAANQKLAVYVKAVKADEAQMKALEEKLKQGLIDFMDKGVEVYEKDGVIYVNMEDKLLYKSGSAALGKDAKNALGIVAGALNDYPDLKVVVIGNTDDKKFKNSNADNLSLSTERANGVVRVLRDDYKVEATRLLAAGKGKSNPIADNKTEEGRAKNRRTEIVLRPDFEKVMEGAKQQ